MLHLIQAVVDNQGSWTASVEALPQLQKEAWERSGVTLTWSLTTAEGCTLGCHGELLRASCVTFSPVNSCTHVNIFLEFRTASS